MTATDNNMTPVTEWVSVDQVVTELSNRRYVIERSLATALFLALKLGKPLLLEGEAGVGKTEVAKVLTEAMGARLIRLQCYEGLDVNSAVYEWNYSRQMLHIRMLELEADETLRKEGAKELFSEEFLIKRPLLQALDSVDGKPTVLLIDELDRADEEFEAFLLEILSDFQVTVPEIGTIKAERPPVVIITSNRTREIHDALKRRCLYHWIDYPSLEKEYRILLAKVPNAPETLAEQVVSFVQELRKIELYKLPGVAETLDWATALTALDQRDLEEKVVEETLGVILKYQEDVDKLKGEKVRALVQRAKQTRK
ncbi:MoxR family ATPase [Candidatus Chlorohelix allophototropha]|uniref:MoxR family ATPase n=2 Tax=Candidatus Chlorohelix allophototropha TaxID=3003348 RepID=A0ABY9AXX5_9CHLR|nr:MoxR family ATPase [Chloroflexota bacterium L227-S17]